MRRGLRIGRAYLAGARIGETCLWGSLRRAAVFLMEFNEYAEAGAICHFPSRSITSSHGIPKSDRGVDRRLLIDVMSPRIKGYEVSIAFSSPVGIGKDHAHGR